MLPITSERRANPLQLTQAFLAQRRAAHCLKTAGIKGVISEIDKSRSRIFSHRIIDAEKRQEKIDAVVSDLVKVNALKPSGNECLTFALALKLLLQRFLPDSQLIIGVRTRPFISHAWVEVSGKVIADVPNLRENLSTILIL